MRIVKLWQLHTTCNKGVSRIAVSAFKQKCFPSKRIMENKMPSKRRKNAWQFERKKNPFNFWWNKSLEFFFKMQELFLQKKKKRENN